MDRVLSLLKCNPVFEGSDPELLQRLTSRSSLLHYGSGEVVLHEGEPAQRVFALLSGRVKVYHVSPLGDEVALKLFGAPALFGEAEALGGFPYQEYVKVLEPAEILLMPVEQFAIHLKEDHEAALRMLVDVARRLAISSYTEKSLAFHPSTVRLANYLLDYAEWTNSPSIAERPQDASRANSTALEWRIDLTQEQMAAAIGVTRRSVAKDMAEWQREGILQRKEGCYLIRDLEALRRYGDPDRLTICYSVRRSLL